MKTPHPPVRTRALPSSTWRGCRALLIALALTFLGLGGCGAADQGQGNKPAPCAEVTTPESGSTPINKPAAQPAAPPAGQPSTSQPPAAPPAGQTATSPPPAAKAASAAAEPKAVSTAGELSATPGQDTVLRVGLNIQHLGIGMPLDVFGQNLAVVPAEDGHKCLGLNGVSSSQAFFQGKDFKNFQIDASFDYNFPIAEGKTLTAPLLSLRLGATINRAIAVTVTQAQAEPPMALFSMGGSQYATDMQCSTKPVRWKEDMPGLLTKLTVKKEGGSLTFAYDGETVCTSPVTPALTLTEFSTPLIAPGRIYDMGLTKLDDSDIPSSSGGGQGSGAEATQEQPFPVADTRHKDGETRFDLGTLPTGSPIGGFGKSLIVMHDEEGKYVTPASPAGTYVLFPAAEAKDFSVRFLIKNTFDKAVPSGKTGQFFLFTLAYKNGISEMYTLNLARPGDVVWNSRYYMTRSGPDTMAWTDSTDYRPWNNALDFNEYKVIKEKNLVRFFFNGEFIRSLKTQGDAFASIRINLRDGDRLYDVIVSDLSLCPLPQPKPRTATTGHDLDTPQTGGGKTAQPAKPATPATPAKEGTP